MLACSFSRLSLCRRGACTFFFIHFLNLLSNSLSYSLLPAYDSRLRARAYLIDIVDLIGDATATKPPLLAGAPHWLQCLNCV